VSTWASATFAGIESIRKLIEHGHTVHVGAGLDATTRPGKHVAPGSDGVGVGLA
jgi:hypothetical protein